jgi:hypothetical protein
VSDAMKKILIPHSIALMILVAFNTQAQESLKLGNHIIGGGVSFSLQENDQTDSWNSRDYIDNSSYYKNISTSSSFRFSPYYGRFVEDNKLLGISLTVGAGNEDREIGYFSKPEEYTHNSTSFGTGIFLRWYFPVSERFGIFFQPGANYDYMKMKGERLRYSDSTMMVVEYSYKNNSRSNSLSVSAKVGLYCFIFDQLSIETNLGNFVAQLRYSKNEDENNYSSGIRKIKYHTAGVNLNLANSFTFDQLFTINYYF